MITVTVTGRYPYVAGDEKLSGEYDTTDRSMALIWFGMDYGAQVAKLDKASIKLRVTKAAAPHSEEAQLRGGCTGRFEGTVGAHSRARLIEIQRTRTR